MSEPFIAEVRIFAGNFAPRGWAFCDGQLLPVAQNTSLFSLIGTTYGGDGRTTMGLPNLQGRSAMHPGRGPGLTPRRLGENVGVESVTLAEAQIPQHTHGLGGVSDDASAAADGGGTPANTQALATTKGGGLYANSVANTVEVANEAVSTTGGSQPHTNVQPYLTLNFIIALLGLYPSRG